MSSASEYNRADAVAEFRAAVDGLLRAEAACIGPPTVDPNVAKAIARVCTRAVLLAAQGSGPDQRELAELVQEILAAAWPRGVFEHVFRSPTN